MNLIVAIDNNNGIGKNNIIPWYIPEDLQYFKNITTGNVIVMGKNTYYSINKKLYNRINIILSHNTIKNNITVTSLEDIIKKYKKENIFIIGGASIYNQYINQCKFLYITKIKKDFKCDTFFTNYKNNFTKVYKSEEKIYNNIKYNFTIYKNNNLDD